MEDTIFESQVKNKGCRDLITKNRDSVDISDIVKNRNRVCENKKTNTGNDVGEYAPDDLVVLKEDGKSYCFTVTEFDYIVYTTKKNPYTGKDIPQDIISAHMNQMAPNAAVPLSAQLKNFGIPGRCPVWSSSEPNIRYTFRCDRSRPKGLGAYLNAYVDASRQDCSEGVLYKIYLDAKGKITKTEVVWTGHMAEITPRPKPNEMVTLDKESLKDVAYYAAMYGRTLSKTKIKDIYQHPEYRPKTKVTLFRGYSFNTYDVENPMLPETRKLKRFLDEIKKGTLDIGDIIELKRKPIESWSTNVCVATHFAMIAQYGVVVKYVAEPEETLVDLRRLKNRKDVYELADQAEIMLHGYNVENGKITTISMEPRKVEIYLLMKHKDRWYKTMTVTEQDDINRFGAKKSKK
jgi:hypothetical protein